MNIFTLTKLESKVTSTLLCTALIIGGALNSYGNHHTYPDQDPKKQTQSKPKAATKAGTSSKPLVITLKAVQNAIQFDKKLLTVKAGQKIILNFENPDFMQHNFVLVKPGTMEKVGQAADVLASDPKGAEKNYVPSMPEVLQSTKLLSTQQKTSIEFTAPSTPGNYPYICTFPGHWRIMNGVMKVVK